MAIKELLTIASDSISHVKADKTELSRYLAKFGIKDDGYISLITTRNGLYAFASALQLFPFCDDCKINLQSWNETTNWKDDYHFIKHPFLCFAQDIFGFQFCFTAKGVEIFEPETGDFTYVADNFIDWIDVVLGDYNYYTGYEIAHQWQSEFGAMKQDKRLAGKIPFFLGGEYDIENLHSIEMMRLMAYRADLAHQTYGLEDGQQIVLKTI